MNKYEVKTILQHDLGPASARLKLASRMIKRDYPEHSMTLEELAIQAEKIARDITLKEKPYAIEIL